MWYFRLMQIRLTARAVLVHQLVQFGEPRVRAAQACGDVRRGQDGGRVPRRGVRLRQMLGRFMTLLTLLQRRVKSVMKRGGCMGKYPYVIHVKRGNKVRLDGWYWRGRRSDCASPGRGSSGHHVVHVLFVQASRCSRYKCDLHLVI